MEWTVRSLIEELQKIEDKEKVVSLAVNCIVTQKFHINDSIDKRLYLSNKNEEGYKEPVFD